MPQKTHKSPLASTPDGILHLNQRQLFYLFIGLLLIGGLVFALGIMTGKRMVALAQNTAQDLEKIELQARIHKKIKEEPPEGEEEGEGEAEPEVKAAAEKPPSAAAKKETPPASEVAAAPKAEEKAKEPGAAPKNEPPKEEAAPPPPAEVAKVEKVVPPKSVSTPNQPPPSKEYDPKGIWTIQVGSVATPEQAEKLSEPLKEKGYKVNISTVEIEGKGTRYRVRVGRFTTKEDASEFQKKLEASEKIKTLISRF